MRLILKIIFECFFVLQIFIQKFRIFTVLENNFGKLNFVFVVIKGVN